jgi:ribonuclease HI
MISSSIKVLQVNLNRSPPATESALQIAVELKIDLIIVQEPWLTRRPPNTTDYSNTRSVLHPSFTQILPADLTYRPRTLVYIARSFKPLVTIASSSPRDSDLLVVDIIEGQSKIQLLNIYNEKDQAETGLYTLERCLFDRELQLNSLLLGDFNTHHPWWDPLAKTSAGADDLVNWIEIQDLALLNTPGTGTFFRPNLARKSVLDLTLASSSLANRIEDWQVLPDLGSDHLGLLFTVTGTSIELAKDPPQLRFNTSLANWDLFSENLRSEITNCPTLSYLDSIEQVTSLQLLQTPVLANWTTDSLDLAASELTQAITTAAISSIPLKKPGSRAKPWWNTDLLALRQAMLREQRSIARYPDSKQLYLAAKNSYFLAIKRAKRDHWNQFLEKEDPKSIYKAMAYTKDRQPEKLPPILGRESFQDKCDILRESLFPSPPQAPEPNWESYEPSTWNWSILTTSELENACSAKIKGKTPGPDSIGQDIILQAYRAIPEVFYQLYSRLINLGHHPKCWKQATGAILRKEKKPDYTAPKAYRVISLLNCLGKVSERILAQRLGYLAETTPLLHYSQIGGRLKKSAIDAALLLTNEVESNRRVNRRTSTLFLDVKGAFDHVAKNQLLAILQKLRLPTSLIAWVSSFLADRVLRLSFDSQLEQFSKIETGIPQGSPISPILFLIYIRDLFPSLASSIRVLSYIDDIALTTSSTSLKKNVRILEREVAKLQELAIENAIEFDLAKTELIHFTRIKEAKTATLRLPDGEVIQPKELVRWLGIWFDPNLTFKYHVAIRTSQARSAFERMARLANSERGLSPFAMRQLYVACITSVADYGSPIWWRGQALFKKPLQALQNLGLRKILGVFKTAPIVPMEVEAALQPPGIRLNTSLRKFASRVLKLAPWHPINQELASLSDTPSSKPIAQLERIKASIQDLVDSADLEPLQHFKYPPWNRVTPYTVEISSLSKEVAAQVHNSNLHLGKDDFTIYTDASAIPGESSRGVGVGIVVLNDSQQIVYQETLNLGDSQLVYDGELEGTTRAVEFASKVAEQGQSYYIYSDNQAGLHRLKIPSDNPGQACQIRASQAAELANSKGATISINWVPGHTDVYGNELADSLAKAATKLAPSTDKTSFAVLGSRARKVSTKEWESVLDQYDKQPNQNPATYKKQFPWQLRTKIQIPQGTKRELASSFYQLKLSHGYIKSYLHRIGRAESDLCRCGKRETTEHLLLSCKQTEIAQARAKLRETHGLRPSLKLLMHTKIGIEKTLGFLKETRLCTRKWHLERGQEDEVREVVEAGEAGGE